MTLKLTLTLVVATNGRNNKGKGLLTTSPLSFFLFWNENAMKNLILLICKSLVDYPDEVEIKELTTGKTHLFEIMVCIQDVGKIIGKQGKTAQAIRQILNAVASKEKKRIVIEILE